MASMALRTAVKQLVSTQRIRPVWRVAAATSARKVALARTCARSFATTVIPGDHMKEGLGLPATAAAMKLPGRFQFDRGDELPDITLAYSTYGKLNADGSNAVIVGHSLTSNSCVDEWWGPLIGEGPQFTLDTSEYFVVCCNYMGSVYGSCGPLDVDPRTGRRFAADFPVATLRDNVRAQRLLLDALGVKRLALAVGGSMGGMLAMEWAATYPDFVDRLLLVACCAQHTDWAIGWGEVGRQAIFADPKWRSGYYDLSDPPIPGMSVARQAAMLSYRTPFSFTDKFRRAETQAGRTAEGMVEQGQGRLRASQGVPTPAAPYFEVERYLNYQGDKFVRRFDPVAYVRMTQLLDSHDLGRGRGGDYRAALRAIRQKTLIVGIDSDLLYPLDLQREMASLIPDSSLYVIHTPHGHDGFLIEIDELNTACTAWLAGREHPGLATLPKLAEGQATEPQAATSRPEAGAAKPKRKIKLG